MATHYNAHAHDIGIVTTSGTSGLMLVRKNGVPQYWEYDDEYLATQQFTGEAGYNALPPEKELKTTRKDWRSGFGQEYYDSYEPKRYFDSRNVDLRFKGMAICSYGPTAVTKPSHTTPTITNANFELNSDWTGGAQSGAYYRGGSYSWTVTNGNSAYQDLTGYIVGVEYTFTCYAREAAAEDAAARVYIYDGVGTTNGTTTGLTTSWQQLTVTRRLNIAATTLRVGIEATGGVDEAYFDDAALSHTAITVGTTTCHAEFNNNLYANFGSLLAKLNTSTGSSWTLVAECVSTITDLEPFADGMLYVALQSSTVLEDCEDAWNESVDGDATSTLDTGDYKVGSGSAKLVVGAGLAAGDIIATEAITSTDISYHDGVKLWIKCSKARAAADLVLAIDNTANCASPLENISIPALTANVWHRFYIDISDPSDMTAVISLGLEFNANAEACTIWLDDIEVAEKYVYMTPGETFVRSTHAHGFAKWFKSVPETSPTIWKALPPNHLKAATTPANTANWDATDTNVDSPDSDILELVANEDDNSLQIKKEDRVYYVDSSGNVQVLVGDTALLKENTSNRGAFYWQGKSYYSYGTQSLVEYDAGTVTWLDPALKCTNLDAFDGEIQAISGDEQWLFIAIDNGASVEIMAIRTESVDGTSTRVFHPIAEVTLAGCQHLFTSSVYQRRLYLPSTTAGNDFNYIPLPAGYGSPESDTNKSFKTDGHFITPWHHFNFQGVSKAWTQITLIMEDTTSTVYWECHYQKLGDSGWTDIGDFKTSPTTTTALPVDGSSNEPVSTHMRFKFVAKTGSAASTPKLLGYTIHGILYPTKRKIIECLVFGGDAPLGKNGVDAQITALHTKTMLDEAADSTWPITFYDLWYEHDTTARTVKWGPMVEEPLKFERDPKGVTSIPRQYRLKLQEVTVHA